MLKRLHGANLRKLSHQHGKSSRQLQCYHPPDSRVQKYDRAVHRFNSQFVNVYLRFHRNSFPTCTEQLIRQTSDTQSVPYEFGREVFKNSLTRHVCMVNGHKREVSDGCSCFCGDLLRRALTRKYHLSVRWKIFRIYTPSKIVQH